MTDTRRGPKKPIETIILTLRGQKVILDIDLAELYGVALKALNQAVKRNIDRFPEDFAFHLTQKEWLAMRSQIVTANPKTVADKGDASNSSQIAMRSSEEPANQEDVSSRSQIVTSSTEPVINKEDAPTSPAFAANSPRFRGAGYRPYAFTEHGAIMAATVLNSAEAVAMSLYVVRAFVQMRGQFAANTEILKRLAEIDKTLLEHDTALHDIYRKLLPLLSPAPEKPKRRIGFHANPDDAQAKGKRI